MIRRNGGIVAAMNRARLLPYGDDEGVRGTNLTPMKIESQIRILAGTLVLVSLALAYFFNPWWLTLAAFVAVNLIQSGFTSFCPAEILLRKFQRRLRESDTIVGPP